MTKVIKSDDLKTICQAVKDGKVVSFPTETVYGVGVKFGDHQALDALMDAKNRDYSKAITLMVSDKSEIERYAIVSSDAQKIIDAFMPGMITMVFQKKDNVDDYMTNGLSTIGIRIPDSKYVLALLKKTGPMLVTSANLSNHPNTTNTKEVLDQLDGRIELVVDGKTTDNIASTVVDVSQGRVKILREGKISKEMIEEVLK